MATKKSMWVLFSILVISAWVLGSVNQGGAETMNYKFYNYVTKMESIPVGDVEGHSLVLATRKAFFVLVNGEVGTSRTVVSTDQISGSGQSMQYTNQTFADGSTIVSWRGGTQVGGTRVTTSSATEGEIIKGTGRFEGIKGTITTKIKYFPIEKDEAGAKGIGEGTINYTLPPK